MFRVAICDDIEQERKVVAEQISRFFDRENLRYVISEYNSGESLIAEFEDGSSGFDLILMDIFMEGINGYEASKAIRKLDNFVPIAFLTSSRDYAIESYDVEAVGYLVKPAEEEKLYALLSKLTRTEVPKSLSIKKRGRIRSFDYRDIVYIESHGHTITIHLADGSEESAYYKLDELEVELEDERFIRCHKSYLVNMDFVKYAENDFQMVTDNVVPIRTHGRKEIVDRYTNYFISKHLGGEIR